MPAVTWSSPPRPAARPGSCRRSSIRWAGWREEVGPEAARGLLAGAIVGYLCKHNATLSAAEGGCQAEIGVASGMGGAAIAQAMTTRPQIAANAAGAALGAPSRHDLRSGRRLRQIPCIERCAFGAVKAWTGYLIAKNEISANRRVDIDAVITPWRRPPRT